MKCPLAKWLHYSKTVNILKDHSADSLRFQ